MEKPVHQQVAELPEEDRGKKIQPLEPQRIITPYAIFYDTTRTADYMTAYSIPTKTTIVKTNVDLAMVRLNSHKAFQDGFPFGEIEEYSNLYEGMEAAICGFPLGGLLTKELGTYSSSFAKGIIASNLPAPGATMEHIKGFQLDVTSAPGSSGGPAFSGESAFSVCCKAALQPRL